MSGMNLLPIECTTRSTYEKKVIDLCKEYNIMPTFDNVEGDATGIYTVHKEQVNYQPICNKFNAFYSAVLWGMSNKSIGISS